MQSLSKCLFVFGCGMRLFAEPALAQNVPLPQAIPITQEEADCMHPIVDFTTAERWDKNGKHLLIEDAKKDGKVEIQYYERRVADLQRHISALKAGTCNKLKR